MVLVLHIIIALFSMVYASRVYMRPSLPGLRLSYGLVAATVASGLYLVASTRTAILRTCVTGLLYVGIMSVGIILAQRKLARENSVSRSSIKE